MNETKNRVKNMVCCSECERNIPAEAAIRFEGDFYCSDCFDSLTTFCVECGTRVFRDDNEGDGSRPLCLRCYEAYYNHCDDCGRLILREDEYYDDVEDRTLCSHCIKHGAIFDYSYKPNPIFYGTDSNLYIGVELELDDGYSQNESAKKLREIANEKADHIYIKRDGSLDNGFEIVTHPMTLQYHIEEMPWKEVMEKALGMGYRSHKATTCGLHCHVNRTAFGETYEKQEENISKVLFLVEKYWEELLRFSRRTQGQMNRWAARYGFKEQPNQSWIGRRNRGWGDMPVSICKIITL